MAVSIWQVAIKGRKVVEMPKHPNKNTGVIDTAENFVASNTWFPASILENMPASVLVMDKKGLIIYCNKEVTRLFGYTADEVVGNRVSLFAPDLNASHLAHSLSIEDGSALISQWRGKRRDGTLLWIDVKTTVIQDTEGSPMGFICVLQDITQRKYMEDALCESEERFRLLADTAPAMIWMSDTTGSCTYFNKGWLDFTQRTMEQECGDGWLEGVHPDDREHCFTVYTTHFKKREPFRMEYRLRRFDGQYRWVLDHGVPRFTPSNISAGYIGSCIDITELKEAEEKLRHDITKQVELEQRKDEFISMVSHELKTPVTSVKTFTQVLANRSKKRGDEESLRFLIRMEVQLNSLIRLIGDLLDLTRLQTGKLFLHKEIFSLDQLVVETIENLQGTTQTHQLLLEQCTSIQVYGDRERIMQVLFNLLTNAIKYSPQAKKVLLRLEKGRDQAMLSVQDFGIGVAQDQQTKIFERFYQAPGETERTFPGLGIGLHISHEIIKRHGGKIWVNSSSGKGSIFRVMLPLWKEVCNDKGAEKDSDY
jgi:PAS domain S-box-containing protein